MTDQTDLAAAGVQNIRRTAEETRQAILDAAREVFNTHSYNDITLKEIAAEVGVSAPLIIKYFKTKEGLFVEQLDFSITAERLATMPFPDLGRSLARRAVESDDDSPASLVHKIADAGGSRAIVECIGQAYRDHVVTALTERIAAEAPNLGQDAALDAEARAEAAMSMTVGLSLMRRLVAREYFAPGAHDDFIDYYGALIQGALDGTTVQ
jgi:AcrR family transcriptional regulator